MDMWRHLATSKHFRYGAILTAIGAAGIALFGVFRIAAFSYYGPITLPYTTPIDDISGMLFFGSLPTAELIALFQWVRESRKKQTEEIQTQEIAPVASPAIVSVETPVIATPVVAVSAVATPATTNLIFVDHEAVLMLGDLVSQIPPAQNEHCFCRAMFRHRIGEFVDWSVIHEEMMGADTIDDYDKSRRMVYDAYLAINERAKHDLGIDPLFVWRRKMVKRTR